MLIFLGGVAEEGHERHKCQSDAARAREMFDNGIAAYEAGDVTRAIDLFFSASRLVPHCAQYISHLGLALAHKPSRWNEAKEYCEKAVEMEPFNPCIYLNLSEIYRLSRQTDRAVKVCEDVLRLDPGNKKALMLLKQFAEEETREQKRGFPGFLSWWKR